ncbi:MAG: hypothetical protein WB930_00065 [Syntrophobacteraceae bacterium]
MRSKKFLILLAVLMMLALPCVTRAQHLLDTDTSVTTAALYWNLITGNAVCTGNATPLPGCTGVGTGTLTGFPSSMATTNIPTGGTSGAWTLNYSLAGLPVGGPYTVATQVCIPGTAITTGAQSAYSPPFQFSVSLVPATPGTPTLGQ